MGQNNRRRGTVLSDLVAAHRAGDQAATSELIARSTPIVLGAKVIARWWPLLRASGWDANDRRGWAAEVVLTAAATYDPARGSWSTHVVGVGWRLVQRDQAMRNCRRRSSAGLTPAVHCSTTTRDGRTVEPPADHTDHADEQVDAAAILAELREVDPRAALVLERWLAGHQVSRRRREAALARARHVLGITVT